MQAGFDIPIRAEGLGYGPSFFNRIDEIANLCGLFITCLVHLNNRLTDTGNDRYSAENLYFNRKDETD